MAITNCSIVVIMKYVSSEYEQQLQQLAKHLNEQTFSFDDMGMYHDPALRLERTELAQQDFNRHVPDIAGLDILQSKQSIHRQEQLTNTARFIMQQVVGETRYKSDIEWGVWQRAHEMQEHQNGSQLPQGITAHDVHQQYLRMFEGE